MVKKVIVVVFNGRPLVLTEMIKYADAVILAWHPGIENGNALADVLFAKVNPSGHLTVSLPKKNGQVPLFYNERNSGRPANNRYIDIDCEPLFPFGYGLSYSTFDYSDMSIAKQQIENNENFEVSVTVKNTGKYIGKEFVQLYIHDKVASITQPRNKLVDFQKIELKPSESKRITFIVSSKELAILDKNMKLIVEPGEFDIWIGQNCKDEKNHIVIIVK